MRCGSARSIKSRIQESAVSLAMYEYYSTYRDHKYALPNVNDLPLIGTKGEFIRYRRPSPGDVEGP